MEFKDLLDYCKAIAIQSLISPTQESIWRAICRAYSKKFNTPLHIVEQLDPQKVMIAEFEDQLSQFNLEEDIHVLLDLIYTLEDPEYEREKREELSQFIKQAEKEDIARIKAGKPIHKALKDEKNIADLVEEEAKKMPKGGSINLSYLEKEENQYGQFED